MATNPLLAELNNLSPGAKAALVQAHTQGAVPPALQARQAPPAHIMAPGTQPDVPQLSTGGPSKIPTHAGSQPNATGISRPPDGGAVRSISPITDPHAQPQVPPLQSMNPDPNASLRPGGSNPPVPILPPAAAPL